MRMRFKPYARPELLGSEVFIENPSQFKGCWSNTFANKDAPLWLELGCGKGSFVAHLAAQKQDKNLVAIDITDKVLVLAKRNIEAVFAEKALANYNVRIMSTDIERIDTILDKSDNIERIYINFCNPWDRKSGQLKHRLTHTRQLTKYRDILRDDGEIYFKCDHDGLFEDSLGYFAESGYTILWQTRDLHADEPLWNIRTEHENMFSSEGIKINALIAKK